MASFHQKMWLELVHGTFNINLTLILTFQGLGFSQNLKIAFTIFHILYNTILKLILLGNIFI